MLGVLPHAVAYHRALSSASTTARRADDPRGSYPKLTVKTTGLGGLSQIYADDGRLIATVYDGAQMAELLAQSPRYLAQLHLLETTLDMRAVCAKLLTFPGVRPALAALGVALGSRLTKAHMERFRHIMRGTR